MYFPSKVSIIRTGTQSTFFYALILLDLSYDLLIQMYPAVLLVFLPCPIVVTNAYIFVDMVN